MGHARPAVVVQAQVDLPLAGVRFDLVSPVVFKAEGNGTIRVVFLDAG